MLGFEITSKINRFEIPDFKFINLKSKSKSKFKFLNAAQRNSKCTYIFHFIMPQAHNPFYNFNPQHSQTLIITLNDLPNKNLVGGEGCREVWRNLPNNLSYVIIRFPHKIIYCERAKELR